MRTSVIRMSGGALPLAAFALAFAPAAQADDAKPQAAKPLAIKARFVHTMKAGEKALENGVIVISEGKITAIGAGIGAPDGATVRDLGESHVTPGLIDANCAVAPESLQRGWRSFDNEAANAIDPAKRDFTTSHITRPVEPRGSLWGDLAADAQTHAMHAEDDHSVCAAICGGQDELLRMTARARRENLATADDAGPTSVSEGAFAVTGEQSSEVVPHTRVADSLNLYAKDFRRLARNGVTTVFAAPDPSSVIGAAGAIVKTAGPVRSRMVEANSAVQAAFGADSFSRGAGNNLPPTNGPEPSPVTRRPTTRMGVDWVMRKAFYDARLAASGRAPYGADTPPFAAFAVLQDILAGKRSLRIQARMRHDIESAIRVAKELGLRFTLVEAIEAYNAIPALKSGNIPVIFGPLYMTPSGWRSVVGRGFGNAGEGGRARLSTAKLLQDAGVPWALTANDLRDEQGLAAQAMVAAANGLSPEEALVAVTRAPAELLGIADRCGSLATGLDADLVAWSGPPTDPTSKVLLVIINGQVVHDAMDK